MSSSGIQSINSGPLIIRTYNQSVTTLSTTNTYLLGQYDIPISSNYLLITTLNGQLAPTNHPTISSFNISTLHINNGYLSTFNASTIYTSSIYTSSMLCSTLFVSTTANIRYEITTLNPLNAIGTTDIDKSYWGKYIFVNPGASGRSINLKKTGSDTPANGITMTFKNIGIDSFTINNIIGEPITLNTTSSLKIMWNTNEWYFI